MLYFQVDLLVETNIEGVTVWNWQETFTAANEVLWDEVVHFGVHTLSISYGRTKQDIVEYNQVGGFLLLIKTILLFGVVLLEHKLKQYSHK